MPRRIQPIGGRKGCAAGAGGTGVFEPADQSPWGGMNATNTLGTVITTADAARHRHAVWQQSPWPVAVIGTDMACNPADTIIAPWQCVAPFVICGCDCEACTWLASVIGGAPNASAVHASNAKPSVRRNNVERGRGKWNMPGSIDAANLPLNPGVAFMRMAGDAYTAAMPGIDP